VTAPLLVAHGSRDPRVPKHESDQFVAAMRQLQKPVRYVEFDYAGHGFVRPEHRREIFAAVAAHFREHLGS
jgi:dipeptidyl aminopeptidase/acylaminoacyl peptidase